MTTETTTKPTVQTLDLPRNPNRYQWHSHQLKLDRALVATQIVQHGEAHRKLGHQLSKLQYKEKLALITPEEASELNAAASAIMRAHFRVIQAGRAGIDTNETIEAMRLARAKSRSLSRKVVELSETAKRLVATINNVRPTVAHSRMARTLHLAWCCLTNTPYQNAENRTKRAPDWAAVAADAMRYGAAVPWDGRGFDQDFLQSRVNAWIADGKEYATAK